VQGQRPPRRHGVTVPLEGRRQHHVAGPYPLVRLHPARVF
jgi:hypothetical protein